MSQPRPVHRLTVPAIAKRKGGEPLVSLTAYSAAMAKRLDPFVDILLVGDSVGMVIYGLDSTLPVTLDMMIAHGAAVVRGSRRACVVVDLPFATYQECPAQAFRSAARVLAETGCSAVKIEGGTEMAETIDFLVRRGIPVVGHVGLTPQSVNRLGGYGTRGRQDEDAAMIMADAKAVADAGAFAVVVEGVVETLATAITEAITAPTIGIGASAACDGQVLVSDDMLGLFSEFTPRFVRQYADLGTAIDQAARAYAEDVRNRRFPGPENVAGVRKTGHEG